ncbi:dipeptidase [Gleimia sp. 6138-11-ORH1]|uniref:dipeptidase n=1 Tax=Gleimia sp. 6138-11-ORH1 TaxID=2973937 RepID=UPI002169313C|nr:dipeptidase [Gleimia sp. 6138-11-ORH1]MCS4484456.1 dipeptidase [Gleimia sp. 6138-11-ORH1]
MIETLREKLNTQFPGIVDELCDLIRIPSVSSSTFDQEKVWESARHVEARFKALGLSTQILSAPAENGEAGRPAVVAQTKKIAGAPTVLLYAHHDVQPAGDESRWQTPPFEPSIRDGRLYGRGSSDDGAGIVVHWGALQLLAEELPVNVTVFIEGEEEIGSPSFNNFLRQYHDLLEADYIIVADSDNWQVGAPALTSSLRGLVDAEVHLQVLEHALHSGMFGGPILDAVTLASRLIATFHDDQGDVAIAGLAGSKEADVDWDEADFRRDSSLLPGVELAGTGDLASRMWTQPALSIIGFDATSVANASNTIAPECRFKVSVRLAPGTDGKEAMAALVAHINANIPFGAKVTVTEGEFGPSYQADLSSEAAQIAHQALSDAWGVPSVNIGVGGSIPFISDFQREFPQAQVIVTGVEDPATNAHSENESQHLGDLEAAVLAEALMLLRFAKN